MSSGLIEELDYDIIHDMCEHGLNAWLRTPLTGTKGEFNYLPVNDILGYAFIKLTGMEPRDFFVDRVLAPLGIDDSDIGWNDEQHWYPDFCKDSPPATNPNLMSGGLLLTAAQMAKIGLLYLAKGASSPEKMVVSSQYIEDSLTEHIMVEGTSHPPGTSYGYQNWYKLPFEIEVWMTDGAGRQRIIISPDLKRVAVQQLEFPPTIPPDPARVMDEPAIVGMMQPSLSYGKPKDGDIQEW